MKAPLHIQATSQAAHLTIDCGAIAANWIRLQKRISPAEVSAVVKADAYGLGLGPVAKSLDHAGCRTFFVALLQEAEHLRAILPNAIIYVLNGLSAGAASHFAACHAHPVLGSYQEIKEWAAFRRLHPQASACAIHVDTGMNRLGLGMDEFISLKDHPDLKDAKPALLMSHLVSAEETDNPLNRKQIEALDCLRAAFPDIPASLANSSGIFLPQQPYYDLVRPGYALYGGNPLEEGPNPMEPVIQLNAPILLIRDVRPGDTAGYNAEWCASTPGRLATIGIGYADGFPRAPNAIVLINKTPCPVVGRISMDLIIADVTQLPQGSVQRGDWATIIGEGNDLDRVASRAGTIGYQLLTTLGQRFERIYI